MLIGTKSSAVRIASAHQADINTMLEAMIYGATTRAGLNPTKIEVQGNYLPGFAKSGETANLNAFRLGAILPPTFNDLGEIMSSSMKKEDCDRRDLSKVQVYYFNPECICLLTRASFNCGGQVVGSELYAFAGLQHVTRRQSCSLTDCQLLFGFATKDRSDITVVVREMKPIGELYEKLLSLPT